MSLLVCTLAACTADDAPPPSNQPLGCTGGGVIDQNNSTSTHDSITLFGTVNLGNCDGAADLASVVVTNVTTGMAGEGHASAPYCAAFFREYDVWANAPLRAGANRIEVRVQAGAWRACETVDVSCSPCTEGPGPVDAGVDSAM